MSYVTHDRLPIAVTPYVAARPAPLPAARFEARTELFDLWVEAPASNGIAMIFGAVAGTAAGVYIGWHAHKHFSRARALVQPVRAARSNMAPARTSRAKTCPLPRRPR